MAVPTPAEIRSAITDEIRDRLIAALVLWGRDTRFGGSPEQANEVFAALGMDGAVMASDRVATTSADLSAER